ncbi:MAG: DNA integrity scanning protein DisA nucleotide-binding domain protein, partial [Bacteroidales bacterium]|nr:DNA integrity scanning protein DisA nucleotide-binding domain protein [Bacteroidales bacterium]
QERIPDEAITEIADAVFTMASSKTGALIVLSPMKETILPYLQSGELIESRISSALLQNIFYKNTPLHDGAVIIVGRKILSAKSVLPISKSTNLPMEFGMRHRSALGMSEETNTLIIVVSEQTGGVSCFMQGRYEKVENREDLENIIKQRQQ